MKRTLLALFVAVLMIQSANAAVVITVGSHNLLANTAGQQIDILIASDPGDPLIAGSNLHVQLGDGNGAMIEPIFAGGAPTPLGDQGFTVNGSIFDVAGTTISGGTGPGGFQQLIDAGATPGSSVAGNGVFMSVFVDTTGLNSGTYDLQMLLDVGGQIFPTELLDDAGAPIGITFNQGSVTIGVIPEPGSAAVVGALACLGLMRRRRS